MPASPGSWVTDAPDGPVLNILKPVYFSQLPFRPDHSVWEECQALLSSGRHAEACTHYQQVWKPAEPQKVGIGLQFSKASPTAANSEPYKIVALVQGRPAATCGTLAPGDELLEVDGWPCTGKDVHQITQRIMGLQGSKVTLCTKRGTARQIQTSVTRDGHECIGVNPDNADAAVKEARDHAQFLLHLLAQEQETHTLETKDLMRTHVYEVQELHSELAHKNVQLDKLVRDIEALQQERDYQVKLLAQTRSTLEKLQHEHSVALAEHPVALSRLQAEVMRLKPFPEELETLSTNHRQLQEQYDALRQELDAISRAHTPCAGIIEELKRHSTMAHDELAGLGLQLDLSRGGRGPDVVVFGIIPDLAAHKNGQIAVGDYLVSIDGEPASGTSLAALKKKMVGRVESKCLLDMRAKDAEGKPGKAYSVELVRVMRRAIVRQV